MIHQNEEFKEQKRAVEAARNLEELNAVLDQLNKGLSFGIEEFRKLEQIKLLMGRHFVGPEDYKILGEDITSFPALPKSLTLELLNSSYPLESSLFAKRKIKDTHVLCYIAPTIGAEKLTISKFEEVSDRYAKQARIDPCIWIEDRYKNLAFVRYDAPSTGHWVLIPKSIIPHSMNKTDAEQSVYLRKWYPNYETAKVRDMGIGLGMYYLKTGEKCLPSVFGSCQEADIGSRVIFGNFHDNGLGVYRWFGKGLKDVGRVAVRKL